MCNKIFFQNEDEAKKHIIYIRNQRGRGGGHFKGKPRAYKCFHCDGWHLTSRAKKADRKYKQQGK